ncbi:aspartyl protease family protein [Sphingomonas sp. SUN019]|uniref:aspartyl protease family protein n=1 Tax=Sphingomonas sp. SUN019 TaxID=2937788 RepID=UPI0021649738|nr:aspartyl protease family protein [Sphingomonas sp. SUN019]UVO50980.1 aspartyl protease family protein [Sphingomonas sp. SUN019]
MIEWRRTGRRIVLDIDILRPDPATDLTAVRVVALLDTGATSSGVAKRIADELRLPSIGKEPINTAGGTILAERFLFRVAFPISGSFPHVFDDITGFELTDHGSFQAVLGMDVLCRCDFTMQRNGDCTLRF